MAWTARRMRIKFIYHHDQLLDDITLVKRVNRSNQIEPIRAKQKLKQNK